MCALGTVLAGTHSLIIDLRPYMFAFRITLNQHNILNVSEVKNIKMELPIEKSHEA